MAKILVVSTDVDARELIIFALRFAGHQLKSVSNAEECIDQTRQFDPDLLLLDETINRESKINRYLKSHEITAGVPLFLFASNRLGESFSSEEKSEVEGLVLNRISPDQFTDRVNTILKRLRK